MQFSVTERSAAAAVAIPGAWAVVEEDGRVLALEPYPAAGMVPILGMNVAHAAPGDWLNADHRGAVAVASAL